MDGNQLEMSVLVRSAALRCTLEKQRELCSDESGNSEHFTGER